MKKHAKKVLCGMLSLTMAMTAFAGCGTAASSSSAVAASTAASSTSQAAPLEGEITFWHSFTQGARMEAVQAAAESFMKENPGVKINIETYSWGDFNTKWNAGLTTGDLPDMSTAQGTGEVVEMLNADVLQPVDDLVDAVGRDRFSANALADMTKDDAVYLVHETQEEDDDRTRIYNTDMELDGAIMYGKPGKKPPLWLHGVMVNEMKYFNGIMHGEQVSDEFKPLLNGSAARAVIATADAATLSLKENRKVAVSEITNK